MFGIYTGTSDWNPTGGNSTNQWYTDFVKAETAIGQTINVLNHFPSYNGPFNWPGQVSWTIGQSISKRPGLIPIISSKLIGSTNEVDVHGNNFQWNSSSAYLDVANGLYDDVWKGYADAIADNGLSTAFFRVAYEANGTFMQDFFGYDATTQGRWKSAVERAFTVAKARAAVRGIPHFYCCICPTSGSNADQTAVMPNPSTWDIWGYDFYNAYWGNGDVYNDNDRKAFWDDPGWGMGILKIIASAKSLNKPLAIFEHGSGKNGSGVAHGGYNDGAFWDYSKDMVLSIRSQNLKFALTALWDIHAGDMDARFSDGSQPAVLQKVQQYKATYLGDRLY